MSHPRPIALPSTHTLRTLNSRIETLSTSLLHPTDPPQVQSQVQSFLQTLFSLSLPSLDINGTTPTKVPAEGDPEPEEFEDYDYALNEEVQRVQAEIERETEKVAKLRREGPVKVVQGVRQKVDEGWENDLKRAGLTGGDEDMEDLWDEETQEEREAWEKVLKSLEVLKDGLPAAASRVMGANEALGVVVRPKKI